MSQFKRIFLIVLDSAGIGHAEDAELYNDSPKSNTFLNTDKNIPLHLPNMERLGLGHYDKYQFISEDKQIKGAYAARLHEKSKGKDTMTGHWELMGINTTKSFKTFTDTGFPKELINELEKQTGRGIIGNCAASGTEIIKELGEEHLKTGKLIVYTSSDSVLQIAANEAIVPIDELYRYCEIAREICMKDEWKVGRIIARPFIGDNAENFKRTPRRHDYALSPSQKTYMDLLKNNNYDVIAIGKINDIFNGCGVTKFQKTVSNDDGMDKTIEIAKNDDFTGLCFVNLVDFDMEYGHRRDIKGYHDALEQFDKRLGEMLPHLKDDDLIILTADHGNDPTQPGTDHTRETIPALFYSPKLKSGKYLGSFHTFAVLGSTIAANFGLEDSSLLHEPINSLFK